MSTRTAALATFLRRAQWLLDDVAFLAGAGRLDADQVDATASALEEVVRLLREVRPTVIDQLGED
ncbi:hypothetical protein [Saccharopolyspora hordei]|uniref:Signal transduction histidine kinase n=1 Tax=Saccharopolyspora hordei TaxID=1838 RepID=A0A853ALC2_9PSEU|nr:hypothetical protein [Saccharopolyspora hordei]NYI85542.1 signal transduction histidine kinase [Saccharopolyspora hordei]